MSPQNSSQELDRAVQSSEKLNAKLTKFQSTIYELMLETKESLSSSRIASLYAHMGNIAHQLCHTIRSGDKSLMLGIGIVPGIDDDYSKIQYYEHKYYFITEIIGDSEVAWFHPEVIKSIGHTLTKSSFSKFCEGLLVETKCPTPNSPRRPFIFPLCDYDIMFAPQQEIEDSLVNSIHPPSID